MHLHVEAYLHEGTDALRPNTRTVHFLHVHFHYTCSTSTPYINYARIEFTLHLHHICIFCLHYNWATRTFHLRYNCMPCVLHVHHILQLHYA